MQKISIEKIKKIKLLITDIDGVWTDGGLYYDINGQQFLRFSVRDGMGVKLLREKGIETAIISGNSTEIVKTRAQKLNIELVFIGVENKQLILEQILELRNLKLEEIAFIGDDVNDLFLFQNVGISAAPCDAEEEVFKLAHFKCSRKGGYGAFREFANYILKYR
jgi:YrbI family 3-deoxy-D-manno-octulosonate 8-phosphate phosphatase